MSNQHPGNEQDSRRRYIIFFHFLILAPFILSAKPSVSLNKIGFKYTCVSFAPGLAQSQNVHFQTDTLQIPAAGAASPAYVEATYPGGPQAWGMHLMKTVRYPPEAFRRQIEGTVTVTFLVDAKGRVRKPQAIGGPEELQEEAIRVIRQGGKWIPARINGEFTESYKQQTVIFKFK